MATGDDEVQAVADRLRAAGIRYRWLRRSSSQAFSVKVAESARALVRVLALALRDRPAILHARSYLPAAVAAVASTVPGTRLLFDMRGLLGEEYVDAGHWRVDSARYRLLKRVERRLFRRSDAIVVLTERHRRHLYRDAGLVQNTYRSR